MFRVVAVVEFCVLCVVRQMLVIQHVFKYRCCLSSVVVPSCVLFSLSLSPYSGVMLMQHWMFKRDVCLVVCLQLFFMCMCVCGCVCVCVCLLG